MREKLSCKKHGNEFHDEVVDYIAMAAMMLLFIACRDEGQ
jgi:hypothetical protein